MAPVQVGTLHEKAIKWLILTGLTSAYIAALIKASVLIQTANWGGGDFMCRSFLCQ